MACAATLNGLLRDCDVNLGGIKAVYITNRDDVTSVTVASGAVTAITLDTGKYFHAYAFKKGQGSLTSTPQFNDAGEYAGEQSVVSLNFTRQTATKRTEIAALSVADLVIIVKDNNDQSWYLGYENPVNRSGGNAESGAALSDTNKYAIEFSVTESQLPLSIAGTVYESLIN